MHHTLTCTHSHTNTPMFSHPAEHILYTHTEHPQACLHTTPSPTVLSLQPASPITPSFTHALCCPGISSEAGRQLPESLGYGFCGRLEMLLVNRPNSLGAGTAEVGVVLPSAESSPRWASGPESHQGEWTGYGRQDRRTSPCKTGDQ